MKYMSLRDELWNMASEKNELLREISYGVMILVEMIYMYLSWLLKQWTTAQGMTEWAGVYWKWVRCIQ